MAGRKIFVGSLPYGIQESVLRDEFGKYGEVEEIFIKPGCDPGRQWAFITFATPQQAQYAKDNTDRVLHFPGAERPCDVMLAKNQGMFGQQSDPVFPSHGQGPVGVGGGRSPPSAQASGARKIFVGSLPDGMSEEALRAEFSKYGIIEDVFMKDGCESGRQWAFVTYQTYEQAAMTVEVTNGKLMFEGAFRPCEVMFAKHQGMFGQDPMPGAGSAPAKGGVLRFPSTPIATYSDGPKKIFVGTLPDGISETIIRAEFSKYGQIVDVFLKTPCEPGRQWGFVTFASHEQAVAAKEATDRALIFPGGEKPCEVMLAKNQGKFGQASPGQEGYRSAPVKPSGLSPGLGGGMGASLEMQPPPPSSPPPSHLTPWRMYKTAAGLPYYQLSLIHI